MRPEQITALLQQPDGFLCARWGRPIAPVVFGLHEDLLATVKGAIEAIARLCAHEQTELDPEFGANLFLFFFKQWEELGDVPELDQMIPDLGNLIVRASRAGANQSRIFRYDEAGAIKAVFSMVRIEEAMSADTMSADTMPAEVIALDQAVRSFTVWGPQAFSDAPPLQQTPGRGAALRPEIAALLRAIYDPVLPACTRDETHAYRLAARMGAV